jgi:hypothetical protein
LLDSAPEPPVALEVAGSAGGAALIQAALGPTPQPLQIGVADGERDIDLWLRATSPHGLPLLLHRVVLERTVSVADRLAQVLPLAIGLAVLFLLARREPLGVALVLAVASLAAATLALQVLRDPVALLEERAATRESAQVAIATAVGMAALWRVPGRWLAVAALALVSWILFLPTAHHGLVSDDFLWAREWTVRDVASSFIGPEDPSGASNVYYRPLSTLSHATDSWVWGDRVAGYHVTNLLLHALAGAAALLLLERLGLSRRAALLGALAWLVHPMAASSVAWASQRTDLIVSFFYLSALALMLSPLGARIWPPLVAALLAFGSKEVAISLPAMAALAVRAALPIEARTERRRALGALWALAAGYLAWWVWLFPDKAQAKIFADAPRAAGGAASSRLGLGLVDIYTQVFLPMGYERWWNRAAAVSLGPVLILASFAVVVLLAWRLARDRSPALWAAAALAAAWPGLVSIPLFGLGLVDVYRLGLLPSLGFALAAAAAGCSVEKRVGRAFVLAALVIVSWMAPLAVEAADEWGPGGFYYEMSLSLTRRGEDWLAVFAPRGRARFWAEHDAREHVLGAWKVISPDQPPE